MDLTTEKRSHPRIPLALYGHVRLADGDHFPTLTRDVSGNGMSFSAPGARICEGEEVRLTLAGIGDVEGRIVRRFEGGFAIALHLDDAQQADIARRIDEIYLNSPIALVEIPMTRADPDCEFAGDFAPRLTSTLRLGAAELAGHTRARLLRTDAGAPALEFISA